MTARAVPVVHEIAGLMRSSRLKASEKPQYRRWTSETARRKLTIMMNAPYEDRIEFWKLQHASITFSEVTQLCEYMLREAVDSGHPLHVPLMTALHTLYGRPFKQRKEVRLAEDIVPANFRDDHVMLLTMRDKIHAHTDVDGPKTTDDDCLNKVGVTFTGGGPRFSLTMVGSRANQIERIRNLADTLSQTTGAQAEKIFMRYFKGAVVEGGIYEVNISKGEDVFLKPSY